MAGGTPTTTPQFASMAQTFWIAALGFHLAVGAAAWWLGRRWVLRLRKVRPAWLWLLQLLADAMLLGFAALFGAVTAAMFVPAPAFTAMRLISQAVFGEGVLLAGWIAWLHGRESPRARALLPAAVAVLLVGVYFEAYHRGPYDLQVRRHTVDRTREVRQRGTLRLLHLSDLQTHRIGAYERRVIDAAKALNPDLIVFTGDYLQPRLGRMDAGVEHSFLQLMATLGRPRYGFYTVDGDVEGGPGWKRLFTGLPVTCLQNETVLLGLEDGTVLNLVGLDNRTSRGRDPEALRKALEAAPPGDLRFVAAHSPNFVQLLSPGEADLALAGHTHGGQVVVPGYGPPITLTRLPRQYAGGLNDYRGLPLHVSRGIGMERITAPQIRFLCPPEICLLEIWY